MASRLGPSGRVSTSRFPFSFVLFILYLLKVKHKICKKWRLDSARRAESRLRIFPLLSVYGHVSFYSISSFSFQFSSISFLIYVFYFLFIIPLISFLTTLIFIFLSLYYIITFLSIF